MITPLSGIVNVYCLILRYNSMGYYSIKMVMNRFFPRCCWFMNTYRIHRSQFMPISALVSVFFNIITIKLFAQRYANKCFHYEQIFEIFCKRFTEIFIAMCVDSTSILMTWMTCTKQNNTSSLLKLITWRRFLIHTLHNFLCIYL